MDTAAAAPRMKTPGDVGEAIRVDNVDVTFHKRGAEPFRAIKELSFAIPRGTVFCLLGPNGSGKTTMINLLTGLLQPSSGTVRVLGLEPTRQRRELLRRISLVPQETALYAELTGRENLEFHARYYGVPSREVARRVDHVLGLVSLTDRAKHRSGTYSGGMQRRLALARALLTDPDVLFLDEPTLGVDVQSRQAIWEQVAELANKGCTVVLTTNYMEEADKLGREVLIIDQGATVVRGTPVELKAMITGEQVELTFSDAERTARARQALAEHEPQPLPDGGLAVRIPAQVERVDFLKHVLDRLAAIGGVTGFRFSEPSLQDVFLHFTGRALRN
jgi:ABC-2 type transport system ATP-binding protein